MSNPLFDPSASLDLRQEMVREQLLPRGIRDSRVLKAMEETPRELFATGFRLSQVYWDGPLPIGEGQTISQPYMVAVMAERLELDGSETVLEIGAGSGYGAAILGQLAKRVVAVERIPSLLERARERWRTLGLDHIDGVLDDGTLGWPGAAPYDGISVTAAAPDIPPTLFNQLRIETGRMIIPIGSRGHQMLTRVRRGADDRPVSEALFPCVFVPLLGKEGW